MKNKHLIIPVVVAGVILGLIVGKLVGSMLYCLVLFPLVSWFVVSFLVPERKKKESEESKEDVPPPVTEESKKQDDIMEHLDSLVKLNFDIRNDPLRDSDIVNELEKIINDLVDIIPVINEESNDVSLVHVINNIGDDYLPRLINPYIKLSESDRKQKTSEILDGLKEISNKVASTAEKINKGEFDKIEMEVSFLKTRCQG